MKSEEEPRLSKIQKNVYGMINEARRIIKSSSLLSSYENNQDKSHNQLKLFLKEPSLRYSKIERTLDKKTMPIMNNQNNYSFNGDPIFFNKSTNKYQLSSILSQY